MATNRLVVVPGIDDGSHATVKDDIDANIITGIENLIFLSILSLLYLFQTASVEFRNDPDKSLRQVKQEEIVTVRKIVLCLPD